EFSDFQPDLVLLDIILPNYDGFYWCGKIRMISRVPIIFISSRGADMDIIIATNMGGDDYIVKPFSIDVLLAKINCILRRTYSYGSSEINVICHEGIVYNIGSGTISANGFTIELTKNEAQIFHLLLKNHGNIVSRERIIRSLWKEANFIDDNTLTVNMTRLRKKLADIGLEGYIQTKKNLGYLI
ncbi:MAG TPA: response regulator transcription factor, partial [Clostridia bacterium]